MPRLKTREECDKIISLYHSSCRHVFKKKKGSLLQHIKLRCAKVNFEDKTYQELLKILNSIIYKSDTLKACHDGRVLYRNTCKNTPNNQHEPPIKQAYHGYTTCIQQRKRVEHEIKRVLKDLQPDIPQHNSLNNWSNVRAKRRKTS
jgi:hypothetical protein